MKHYFLLFDKEKSQGYKALHGNILFGILPSGMHTLSPFSP